MSCDTCGTIERYGRRVKTRRRLCIDCWKLYDQETKKSPKKPSSNK